MYTGAHPRPRIAPPNRVRPGPSTTSSRVVHESPWTRTRRHHRKYNGSQYTGVHHVHRSPSTSTHRAPHSGSPTAQPGSAWSVHNLQQGGPRMPMDAHPVPS
jgi:hypothetical protein